MAAPATPNFDAGAAQASVQAQKASLLAALAQGGTAMAQQTAYAQQAVGASSAAAAQQAAARSVSPAQAAQASSAAGGQGAYYANLAASQGGAGSTAMNTLSQVNSNYMDQVGAAVPLVHAQTGRELQSMQHAASEAAADRALRRQIAQMQLQESQSRLAASAAGKYSDPLDREEQELRNSLLRKQVAGSDQSPQDQMAALRLQDELDARSVESGRESLLAGEGPAAAAAARLALAGADNQAEALANLQAEYGMGQAKTPGGKDLDQKYMQSLLARLYAVKPGAKMSGSTTAVGGFNRPGA